MCDACVYCILPHVVCSCGGHHLTRNLCTSSVLPHRHVHVLLDEPAGVKAFMCLYLPVAGSQGGQKSQSTRLSGEQDTHSAQGSMSFTPGTLA